MDVPVKNLINKNSPLVSVYKPFEEVSEIYGMDVYAVTLEQIEALKNGDVLYLEIQAEYSAVIHLEVKGDSK